MEPNESADGGYSVDAAADALLKQMDGPEPEGDPEDGDGDDSDAGDEQPQGQAQDADDEEPGEDDGEQESDEDEPATQKSSLDDNVPVKVRVGKEEREITLGDLKKGYMMGADYTAKTQAVAEARKQFVAEAAQYEDGIKARLGEVDFLASTFMQALVQEEQGTNWEALRQTNPGEFVARQRDIEQRRGLLQRAYAAHQQTMQQQEAIQQQRFQQHVADQAELLNTLVPEWLDGDIASKEKQDVAKYLIDFGVPVEEIENLADSRTVAIVRKAMLYDRMTAQKKQAQQKVVKPVPKFNKPGARDPGSTKSIEQKYFDRAKRSKRVEDWAEALIAKRK